jgi:phenylpropionate dioxygenase-like ring-hydroxylating dioxygenase large terminal subunit
MSQNFNNPRVHIQSWYVACRSSDIKTGSVRTFPLLGRKIVIYRTKSAIHALDARCPHLGADLGKGKVVGERIQCAFHHWEFKCDGNCHYAPGLSEVPKRHTRVYPTQEKWGYVWIWNGPHVLFPLPEVSADLHVIRMPTQTLRCHPHIMIANGLDVGHFSALHGMILKKSELKDKPPFSVEVTLTGHPVSRIMKFLTGTSKVNIDATFETIGGNIALATVKTPVNFAMIFTGNISTAGYCQTHTIAFLPKRILPDFLRALVSMYVLLHDDRRILDDIEFSSSFVDTDEPLVKFAETVNQMKIW